MKGMLAKDGKGSQWTDPEGRSRTSEGGFPDGLGMDSSLAEQGEAGVDRSDGAWSAMVKVGRLREERRPKEPRRRKATPSPARPGRSVPPKVSAEPGTARRRGWKRAAFAALIHLSVLGSAGFYVAGARSVEDARKIVVFKWGGISDRMAGGLGKEVLGSLANLLSKDGER